jgi:hypothetical protein
VQEGALWMLQCRTGKRTGQAAVAIARAFVAEGLTSIPKAVGNMVEPRHLEQLVHPQFRDPAGYKDRVLGKGLPASPGAAGARAARSWWPRRPDLSLAHVHAPLPAADVTHFLHIIPAGCVR